MFCFGVRSLYSLLRYQRSSSIAGAWRTLSWRGVVSVLRCGTMDPDVSGHTRGLSPCAGCRVLLAKGRHARFGQLSVSGVADTIAFPFLPRAGGSTTSPEPGAVVGQPDRAMENAESTMDSPFCILHSPLLCLGLAPFPFSRHPTCRHTVCYLARFSLGREQTSLKDDPVIC